MGFNSLFKVTLFQPSIKTLAEYAISAEKKTNIKIYDTYKPLSSLSLDVLHRKRKRLSRKIEEQKKKNK